MSETWNRVRAAILAIGPHSVRSINEIVRRCASERVDVRGAYLSIERHATRPGEDGAIAHVTLARIKDAYAADLRVAAADAAIRANPAPRERVRYTPAVKRKTVARGTGKTLKTQAKRAQREARKAAERSAQASASKSSGGGKGKGK